MTSSSVRPPSPGSGQRAAGVAGKVGVIRVGAATPAELKELQHRVEDVLSATRAAMAEGIVGGVAALLHAEKVLAGHGLDGDYATGADIVLRALGEPAYLIASNAGYPGGRGPVARTRWGVVRPWPVRASGRERMVAGILGDMEIWHNPRCSKSRSAKQALEQAGVDYTERHYLDAAPGAAELSEVLDKLGLAPWDITRMNEPLARELGVADLPRDRRRWIDLLAANPVLIQRPILIADRQAVVGRDEHVVRRFIQS